MLTWVTLEKTCKRLLYLEFIGDMHWADSKNGLTAGRLKRLSIN